MKKSLLSLLFGIALITAANADDAVMNSEIDHLLETVISSNCTFTRNGKEHGPEAAKDHLNMKRSHGKKYYSNTEEFIDNLASSSSWSGKPYLIRCGEEEQQLAKEWFSAVLAQYRASGDAPTETERTPAKKKKKNQ